VTELACYGFITCFDLKSETCETCEKVKSCQEVCYRNLRDIDPATGDAKKLLRLHERWGAKLGNKVETKTTLRENFQTEKQDKRVQGLSKLASTIARAAIFNYVNFQSLTNEFVSSLQPHYLRIMIEVYMTGSVVTGDLKALLMKELKWQLATAKSYASAFIEVLVHWGLVKKVKRGEYVTL
jgi:hypothetical protein